MKEKVLIIESRDASDHFHNRKEGELLTQILKLGGISAKHFEVLDKDHFVKAVNYAKHDSISYVHFSGHGLEKGFKLTNEFIDWENFSKLTGKLLSDKCLVFSSCLVANGVGKLLENDNTFCNAIIAPTREIEWDEGLVAYSVFYHRAKRTNTTTNADVVLLNRVTKPGTFKYFNPYGRITYALET